MGNLNFVEVEKWLVALQLQSIPLALGGNCFLINNYFWFTVGILFFYGSGTNCSTGFRSILSFDRDE